MTQSTPRLLERAREQAELDAVVASAHGGRGATVVIVGPAGIGKTALLGQARRAMEHGFAVLAARGGEL